MQNTPAEFRLDERQRARLEAVRCVHSAMMQGHPSARSAPAVWTRKIAEWLYSPSMAEVEHKILVLSMATGPVDGVDNLLARADGIFSYILSDGPEKLPTHGAPAILQQVPGRLNGSPVVRQ